MIKKARRNGFTLIEILVVSTIVVVISAIGLVSYSGAQVSARDAQRKQDLDNTRTILLLYRSENGQFPIAQINPQSTLTFSFPRKVLNQLSSLLKAPVVYAVVTPDSEADMQSGDELFQGSDGKPTPTPTPLPDSTVISNTVLTPQEGIAYGQLSDTLLESGYITQSLPLDPRNDDTYYYGYSSDGAGFTLSARLEKDLSVVELTN